MEFVKLKPINRICPCCGNGNYMRIISGKNVGKLNVKCINCNSYYNYDELLKRDNSKPLNGADGRTMDDLISRAAAIEHLMTNMGWHDEDGYEVDDADEKRKVITDLIDGISAVDAAPVVHARWKTVKAGASNNYPFWDSKCSNCDYTTAITVTGWLYCPRCGAKMDTEAGD